MTHDYEALAERLLKRAEQERAIAANSRVVADLLKPQMDKFDARDPEQPWNTYAVRMQLGHQRSAEKDEAFALDLETAAAALRARAATAVIGGGSLPQQEGTHNG
jgi:hypothetical protein